MGRVSEAIPLCATAAEGLAAHYGPEHGRTLIARANLGALVMDGGDLEGARPTLEQVESTLASRQDLLPHRVRNLNNLGCLYFRQRRYADAAEMLRRAR